VAQVEIVIFYFGGQPFESWAGHWLSRRKFFVAFLRSCRKMQGKKPQIRSRPLPSTFFPTYYSLIIPPHAALVAGFPPRLFGFEPRSGHVWFVLDTVALGQIFSEYFGFTANSHPTNSPQSPSSIIWGWYNRQVVAAVPSGLSPTQLRIIIKNNNHIIRRYIVRSAASIVKWRVYIDLMRSNYTGCKHIILPRTLCINTLMKTSLQQFHIATNYRNLCILYVSFAQNVVWKEFD
jgi:hypothetical protein